MPIGNSAVRVDLRRCLTSAILPCLRPLITPIAKLHTTAVN